MAQHADFLQGGTEQTSYSLDAGVTWLVSRYVQLSATYDFTQQWGTGTTTLPLSGNYERSVALLTVRLGL
jgi:hypothetical protein